uniref:Uncharacterized protein n=1 Tax=Setaria italica TaxID=4555 RepID=K4A3Z5_SETIT
MEGKVTATWHTPCMGRRDLHQNSEAVPEQQYSLTDTH